MWKNAIQWAATAALIIVGVVAQARDYRLTLLEYPNGLALEALGLNNHGQIVGVVSDTHVRREQAAVWTHGVATLLPGYGGTEWAVDINRRGQVVGATYLPQGYLFLLRWDNGVPTLLTHPPKTYPIDVVGINDQGRIAGNIQRASGPSRAVVWGPRGRMAYLDSMGSETSVARGINNDGDVAGYLVFSHVDGNVRRPVVWRGGVPMLLDVLQESSCCNQAEAVNDLGQVVGWSLSSNDGAISAVVWNGTAPTALQSLSSSDHALAINNRQQAVGVLNAGGVTSAAMWDLATGAGIDLNVYLTKAQKEAGWVLSTARGINDQGTIVGAASNVASRLLFAYRLTPVDAE